MGRKVAVILFFALLATYIVVVLVPAFSRANGVPADFLSLIWPPALMVIGYGCLYGFTGLAKKNAAEKKD
jgi:hypothetical protein